MKSSNKKLLTTTALTAVIAVSGLTTELKAQSKNFEGTYLSIGAGVIQNKYEANLNSPNSAPTAAANGAGITSDTFASRFVGFNNSATTILRDRKSTRLNSSHVSESRMPSSA